VINIIESRLEVSEAVLDFCLGFPQVADHFNDHFSGDMLYLRTTRTKPSDLEGRAVAHRVRLCWGLIVTSSVVFGGRVAIHNHAVELLNHG
jgi:hypothetical protein